MKLNCEFPYAVPGQRIGILGGSFDPPHSGHVLATLWSLKCFGLDRVWWLVSPGNPLKSGRPGSMRKRMAAARRIIRHPKVEISNFEELEGTSYTCETFASLARKYPGARFVWLMGADNLLQLHHWENWNALVRRVPIGVIARPEKKTLPPDFLWRRRATSGSCFRRSLLARFHFANRPHGPWSTFQWILCRRPGSEARDAGTPRNCRPSDARRNAQGQWRVKNLVGRCAAISSGCPEANRSR